MPASSDDPQGQDTAQAAEERKNRKGVTAP